MSYIRDKLSHRTRLAEKVPQTLHSNEFMEFVFMFRILLDFWKKMFMYISGFSVKTLHQEQNTWNVEPRCKCRITHVRDQVSGKVRDVGCEEKMSFIVIHLLNFISIF